MEWIIKKKEKVNGVFSSIYNYGVYDTEEEAKEELIKKGYENYEGSNSWTTYKSFDDDENNYFIAYIVKGG